AAGRCPLLREMARERRAEARPTEAEVSSLRLWTVARPGTASTRGRCAVLHPPSLACLSARATPRQKATHEEAAMADNDIRKIQAQGVHHITLVGADRQTSIDFWEGVLGMPFIF